MQPRFTLTAVLVATGLLGLSFAASGCGDDGGFQCGPGTMPVRGICLPEELDARRPPTPDGGIDMGPPVVPDLGPPIPPPPPPPDLGPPPDPDMGLPPPVDMGPPPDPDMGLPPPVDMGPPPPVDMGPPEVDMSLPDPDMGPMDMGIADMGPMDMGPMDMGPVDTGPRDMGPMVDAGPGITTPVRLLFSRVVVGGDPIESVEIYNPNASPVDLSRYFITDFESYGELPSGVAPVARPANQDFIIRFPAGAVIGARSFVLVSLRTAVGFHADSAFPTVRVDYQMRGTTGSLMVDYGNAAAGLLSNATEGVGLFYWDEMSDLVTDIDFVRWSTTTTVDPAPNKTGVSVDGPDPGTTPSTYGVDAVSTSTVQPGYDVVAPRDHFLVRCDYTEGAEARRADANGVTVSGLRDDELSETVGGLPAAPPDPAVIATWRAILDMGRAAFAFDSVPNATVCPGGPIGI